MAKKPYYSFRNFQLERLKENFLSYEILSLFTETFKPLFNLFREKARCEWKRPRRNNDHDHDHDYNEDHNDDHGDETKLCDYGTVKTDHEHRLTRFWLNEFAVALTCCSVLQDAAVSRRQPPWAAYRILVWKHSSKRDWLVNQVDWKDSFCFCTIKHDKTR